ncbi:MAG: hypothetical protein ACYDC8_00330 [Gammaproteobacteria bacterium]
MSWKFWEKKKKSVTLDALKSPADAQASSLWAAGLFLQNLFPFSDWQSPDAGLSAKAVETAKFSAQGFQLAMYFWLFSRKFGNEAARIARDNMALTLDSKSDGKIGTMTEAFISFIENAINHPVTQEMQKVVVDGKELDVPPEYWMGMYVLLRMNDSPYYMQDAPALNGDDWAVALCLGHAKDKALPVFQHMMESVLEFNAVSFPYWKWSAKPGAFERHLQRRHNNPLFPAERRIVTTADVYEARIKDTEALSELTEEAAGILQELEPELPGDRNAYLHAMREKIDDLRLKVPAVGGNTAEVEEALSEARKLIVETWRLVAISSGKDAVESLDKAEEYANNSDAELFQCELANQIRHPAGVIPANEIIPALLTEDPDGISKFCLSLDKETTLKEVQAACLDTLKEALNHGFDPLKAQERVVALGIDS